ncbi:MAG TPA: hypothetical protein VN851_07700 [Thermoanaerobaculia bacterium]|nr:hypothetical protein [Thermoanaerobaculia bacterium]
MPHRKRHLALLLALPILLTLFAAPAGALPLERALPELFARGWSFLSSLWAEVGCSVDPHDRCAVSSAPAAIFSEGGGSIDPNGECSASSVPLPILKDAGCGIDPDGRCGQ